MSGEATRPNVRIRPAPAKRNPSPEDAPTTASVSVPCRVRFTASFPPFGGANQTRPVSFEAACRSEERPGGLWNGTQQSASERRMDRQEERNLENTMSGNDMQNRCGLKDTQELRSPPEVDWQQPESPQGGLRHLGEACGPRTGTSARGSDQRPAAVSAPAPRRHASRFRSGFGSRLRATLLSVLALVLGLPFAGPAAAQEVVEVPRAWALKPSGLSSTQNEFRLLFVTSTRVSALSANISDYNAAVQGRARAGHSFIRPFSSKFRMVGSTNTVDALDNTGTTHTSSNRGVPIYWLRGAKVADDYADFYDGSWDHWGTAQNEHGNGHPRFVLSEQNFIWTGSNSDGTKHATEFLGRPNPSSANETRQGSLGGRIAASPLSSRSEQGSTLRYYAAISPVIRLVQQTKANAISIRSTPTDGMSGYAADETIQVRLDFGEAVSVAGTPYVVLTVHRFAYTVAQGDLDTDGMAIGRNTLALGGGTIATVAKSGTVDLRHDSLPRDRDRTVDGVRPAVKAGADGAVALGPELVLTWTEELDPTSVPAGSGGFTVKIGGTVEPAVRSVAIDGATVTLMLARGIQANTTGVTVDYAPQSATPIKDRAGNAAVAFTERTVTARSADNNEATGTVTVSGLATVGQRLTATVSDIADPDGPPSTGYTVTWLRIDGSSETTIRTSTLATGVASNFYTLAALDAGKRIKVKVAFEDYIGNPEEFESAAFPGFGRIMWPIDTACAMPSLAGRELVWTGQVGVGTNIVAGNDFSHGFGAENTGSTLSDETFVIGGTDYTIDYLIVGAPGSSIPGNLRFSTTTDPADVGDKRRTAPCLRRHVPLRGWPRLRH